MKQKQIKIWGFIALSLLAPTRVCSNDATSRSVFSDPDQYFQRGSPIRESMFKAKLLEEKEDGIGGALEIVGYYSKTTDSKKLARYFMPNGATTLTVAEFTGPLSNGGPTIPNDQDWSDPAKQIEARNFNISTVNSNFRSTISFCPEQAVGGIGIAYRQTLWSDCQTGAPWLWLDLAMPIEHVQTNMKLQENVINNGGFSDGAVGLDGAVHVNNMTQALRQSNWRYGKVDNCSRSKWGVADVEVALGWNTYLGDCCSLNGYVGFLAPTGTALNKKEAAYLFSPVVGNGKHWALIFGNYSQFPFWTCGEHELTLEYSLHGQLLFKNTQWRSVDLKNKEWSRYLEVVTLAQSQQAITADSNNGGSSGINYFTVCLEVDPRFAVDTNAALKYAYHGWTLEVGYNFYVREAERACLKSWTPQIAIKDVVSPGAVSLARTIGKNNAYDSISVNAANYNGNAIIQRSDLNLNSATHPGVLTNLVYGTVAWDSTCWCIPFGLSAGGSYQFAKTNTTADRWGVWGKMAVSF